MMEKTNSNCPCDLVVSVKLPSASLLVPLEELLI
jgi:hypothetical protein